MNQLNSGHVQSTTQTKNTRLHYSFTFFNNIDLTSGIRMIFRYARGFTLIEIGFLKSIFHISSFLFEVPTGSIADAYSRKASHILGKISFILSLFIMYFSGNFFYRPADLCFAPWDIT